DSGYSIWELAEFHCKSLCEAPEVGEECGWQSMCELGKDFCGFDGETTGVCKDCPDDINECYNEGFVTHDY
ncbi:hypothetical protein ACHAXN_000369, partial [Cyclotella atomus]